MALLEKMILNGIFPHFVDYFNNYNSIQGIRNNFVKNAIMPIHSDGKHYRFVKGPLLYILINNYPTLGRRTSQSCPAIFGPLYRSTSAANGGRVLQIDLPFYWNIPATLLPFQKTRSRKQLAGPLIRPKTERLWSRCRLYPCYWGLCSTPVA